MKYNYYKASLKALKKVLKYNKNITENEWNKYANEHDLFSSITLKAKSNSHDFEELKKNIWWI